MQVAQCALLADGPVLSSSATDKSAAKLGPQDFEILKVVGQGAFGKVSRARGLVDHVGGGSHVGCLLGELLSMCKRLVGKGTIHKRTSSLPW